MASIDIFKADDDFEAKALEIFRFQATENEVYGNYIKHLGLQFDQLTRIEEIPFLPIELFKTQRVFCQNLSISKVFKSSGTGGDRSHHYIVDPVIYETSFLLNFEAEFGALEELCVLALLPNYQKNPNSSLLYMVNEIIKTQVREGFIKGYTEIEAVINFNKAIGKGILKIMNKIGISTLHSYRGSQLFEIVGFNSEFSKKYFPYTTSRIEGIGLYEIEKEISKRYDYAFPLIDEKNKLKLNIGGEYRWRRNGERHMFNPTTVTKIQQAVRLNDQKSYDVYADNINKQSERLMTIRGLFEFNDYDPIPIDEVEPWTEIVKRFKTGAMSYGSISKEAHENLAIAMNRIGGKSNSGEGGEDKKKV